MDANYKKSLLSYIAFPYKGIKLYATTNNLYFGIRIQSNETLPVSKLSDTVAIKHLPISRIAIQRTLKNTKGKTPMRHFMNKAKSGKNAAIKPLYGIRRVIADFEDSIIDSEIKKLKSKFGVEMYVKNNAEIEILTEWIRQHDPKFKYHISNPYGIYNKKNRTFILEGVFIIKLAPATYLYVNAQNNLYKWGRNDDDNDSNYNPIHIYLFGKKSLIIFNKLSKFIEEKSTSVNKIFSIVGIKGEGRNSFWNCTASKLTPRSIDTIFMDNDQKKKIIDHIDQWVQNEKMYTDRGLLFKTGILLYGKPGTGKSSMAMAIANYLGCGLITIDPTTFQYMNIPEITESIVADEARYVILIDEIDTLFKSRDDNDTTDEQVKNTSKLMQFLDSQQSPTNVLFIATTNYIDRLDKALLRKGRFDIVEEMGDISYDAAMSMCKSFGLSYYESLSIIELNQNPGTDNEKSLYNPANLQNEILKYLKQKEQKVTDVIIDEPENEVGKRPDIIEVAPGIVVIDKGEVEETPFDFDQMEKAHNELTEITDIGYNVSKDGGSREEEVSRLKELYGL